MNRLNSVYVKLKTDGAETLELNRDATFDTLYDKTYYRPKKGITSFSYETSGKYGNFINISLTIRCNTREQLKEFQKVYMVPGKKVSMEFGKYTENGLDDKQVERCIISNFS